MRICLVHEVESLDIKQAGVAKEGRQKLMEHFWRVDIAATLVSFYSLLEISFRAKKFRIFHLAAFSVIVGVTSADNALSVEKVKRAFLLLKDNVVVVMSIWYGCTGEY